MKGEKGEKYFFCMNSASKVYKLCNPITKKIIINFDVIFDEKATWKWNQNDIKESPRAIV